MSKLGQEPAFPLTENYGNKCWRTSVGISKRFYAACAAMQGLISNSFYAEEVAKVGDLDKRKLVLQSYKIADELLKQENEGD